MSVAILQTDRGLAAEEPTLKPSPKRLSYTVNNLSELLQQAALGTNGLKLAYPFQQGAAAERYLSYSSLLELADLNKAFIQSCAQTKRTSIVLMHFDSHADNFEVFWSIVRAGLTPCISTPFSAEAEQRQAHISHLKTLLDDPVCFTSNSLLEQYPEMQQLAVHTIGELREEKGKICSGRQFPAVVDHARPEVLMLTSGSTGFAKAVPLYFPQIQTSIKGKSDSIGTGLSSIFLNWIGLDHVANLMEIHLQAMYLGASQVHVHAKDFLADPLKFISVIDRYRVTHTFGPNFFLAMLEKEILSAIEHGEQDVEVDLSCLEAIVTGGEANSVATANSLTHLLQQLGTRVQVIWPAYGLTEACAALTYGLFNPEYEAEENHEFATIGKPFTGATMRAVRADGQVTSPNEVGLIEIGGSVVFNHYFNNVAATKDSFSEDGWFKTGDRGYVDVHGNFNLAGRKKEVIVINGVKFAPHDIENKLERMDLPGTIASCYAAFAYREANSPTEFYCVIYGTSHPDDRDLALDTAEQIARIGSGLFRARPRCVVGLGQARLEKSSLGKLSRAKLRTQFENGSFDKTKIDTTHPLNRFRDRPLKIPATATEVKIAQTLSEMVDVPIDAISIEQTLFELGITSVSLFRFEKMLRRRFELRHGISIISFLSNPVIESIALSIDQASSGAYNPVAQLQVRGNKTPLWLVHPASGNVLAFLPLARVMIDRPLYGLTARGLGPTENVFDSLEEMADIYHMHLKKTQPYGPYAVMGYSLGSSVAFEVCKRLEAGGDTVAFCGTLDSPPHIAPLVGQLDWTMSAVLVTFFLDLLPQTEVSAWTEKLRGMPRRETADRLLAIAREQGRESLNLDAEQLLAIINIAHNFGLAANEYRPFGSVAQVDCFWCTPLHAVERSREKWRNEYLNTWADFSRGPPAFYECAGDHADMINPAFVDGFRTILDRVLADRGL